MRGTEAANYLMKRFEADAKAISKAVKSKSEEEKVMEEINQEEHAHDFNRLAKEW